MPVKATMTASNERCDIQIEPGRSIRIIPDSNAEQLNEQQRIDYEEHRWNFITWLRERGKNPEAREGYSDYSTYGTAYRTARFDRWVWGEEERYSFPPTPGVRLEKLESSMLTARFYW